MKRLLLGAVLLLIATSALPKGDDAVLTATLKVIAEGKAFSNLTADDMEVKVHGYGILTSISRDGVGDAWEDYQNGGKQ